MFEILEQLNEAVRGGGRDSASEAEKFFLMIAGEYLLGMSNVHTLDKAYESLVEEQEESEA
jgi:hypothetical protein